MRPRLFGFWVLFLCGLCSVVQPPIGIAQFTRGGIEGERGARPAARSVQRPRTRARVEPAWREQQAEQLYLVGRSYIEQGFYGEGLDALNQSLTLRPEHSRALTYKGIALRRLREPALALQQFDQALAVDPDDGVAHGERGLAHLELGNQQAGEKDLRRAGRLRPDLARWFSQQSREARVLPGRHDGASPLATGDEPPVPIETPPPFHSPDTLDEAATAEAAEADGGLGWGRASRLPRDIAAAWALVRPAAFLVAAFLACLIGLRLAFALLRRVLRRTRRPSKSSGPIRYGMPPPVSAPATPLRPPSYPAPSTPPTHAAPPQLAVSANPVASSGAPQVARPAALVHRHRILLRIAGFGFLLMVIFAVPVLVQAFRLDVDKLIAPRVRPTVLDHRGNVYTQLGVPDHPVEYADLPLHLVDALRAREDARFFEHSGVDWLGLARAVVQNVLHGRIKQGASTITMQLVEKVYQLDQKGLLNRVRSKLVEWTIAYRAEASLARKLGSKRAAKEAIVVAYLNRVEFGDGTVGVGAASLYYFKKPVSELTLGESCMLVALLRAPTANSPYRNPENSRMARDSIVAQMVRRGFITEERAKQARFHVVKNPTRPRARHNGYLVAAITREMNALKAQGKLPADVWDHENLSIRSTLDLRAQDILDSEIRKVCSSFSGDTAEDPLAGAGLIVDNKTGQVRALVSGQDYSKSQYDLAFSSRRQVASIAKPFVYGAYLEQGGSIDELVSNQPLSPDEIRALRNWNPGNSSALDPGEYPLATGLAFSDNLITARVGLGAGLRRVYDTLYGAGLLSDKATTGPTWLLGTFTSSLANVVSAYSAIPRGGTRAPVYLVQSVSIDGEEVYRAEPQSVPLFSGRTCKQLHQALREAMTEGTGRTAMRNAGLHASVAGKTGTSQNAADVWWVGYIDDITLGVRFGRDSNSSLGKAAAGGTMAAPVAARVLKKLSEP